MNRPRYIFNIRSENSAKNAARIFLNAFLVGALGTIIFLFELALIIYLWVAKDLPKISSLSDYNPPVVSFVFDKDGQKIGEFFYENQRRILVPLAQIPKHVVNAFVACEDQDFYKHRGVDFNGLIRASIVNLRAKKIVQGGSTITQQLTKSLLLTSERTWKRKVKEAILALRIERSLTKEEILTLYLNQIYLGNGAYGIQAAAQNYFGKDVDRLTFSEAALIAGITQAPSRNSPFKNPQVAKARQIHVLHRMVDDGYITERDADQAARAPWELHNYEDPNVKTGPYFVDYVRWYLIKKYGAERVLKDGLKIYTTMDSKLQITANRAIDAGLRDLDKRHGYFRAPKNIPQSQWIAELERIEKTNGSGPFTPGQILEGLVVEIKPGRAMVNIGGTIGVLEDKGANWVKIKYAKTKSLNIAKSTVNEILAVGDLVQVKVLTGKGQLIFGLEQKPFNQGALVCMDIKKREVKAIVGGRDFTESPFDRAIQARRQPGSAFKPIIYSAALDAGMTPATVIMDTALVFADGWRPNNYDGHFSGNLTLRQALTHSVNTVTIRILEQITPDYAYRFARRLGITSLKGYDLSMALGSYEVAPIELMNAFAVFVSGGILAPPIFIKRVEDRNGKILEENSLDQTETLAPSLTGVPRLNPYDGISTASTSDQALASHFTSFDRSTFFQNLMLTPPSSTLSTTTKSSNDAMSASLNMEKSGTIPAIRILSKQTAYLITSLMQSVCTSGTGARASSLGKTVAGKTGTTNDAADAWFIASTPEILTGVWVGNDQRRISLGRGESGSKAALPIWLDFMKTALQDRPDIPFDVPEGIVTVKIDPINGLLARQDDPNAIMEIFRAGTEPTTVSPTSGSPSGTDFYKFDMESF